eukprot:TRINITY_DN745_c0_g1_i2.p1 TRINITY_DN745_c0_g1~~TRINITY_DN745_c0_g1_i2.p1  ORF type:complete len:577 (-),score=135.43 TRINITY_DN745_c0_g1_i2:418-2115(-)
MEAALAGLGNAGDWVLLCLRGGEVAEHARGGGGLEALRGRLTDASAHYGAYVREGGRELVGVMFVGPAARRQAANFHINKQQVQEVLRRHGSCRWVECVGVPAAEFTLQFVEDALAAQPLPLHMRRAPLSAHAKPAQKPESPSPQAAASIAAALHTFAEPTTAAEPHAPPQATAAAAAELPTPAAPSTAVKPHTSPPEGETNAAASPSHKVTTKSLPAKTATTKSAAAGHTAAGPKATATHTAAKSTVPADSSRGLLKAAAAKARAKLGDAQELSKLVEAVREIESAPLVCPHCTEAQMQKLMKELYARLPKIATRAATFRRCPEVTGALLLELRFWTLILDVMQTKTLDDVLCAKSCITLEKNTAVHFAVMLHALPEIQRLVSQIGSTPNSSGHLPVHLAVLLDKVAALQTLVSFNAHTGRTKSGDNAAHLAVRYGSLDALKMLLGIRELHVANSVGDFPVHVAVITKRSIQADILKTLLSVAPVSALSAKNKAGLDPLTLATQHSTASVALLATSGKADFGDLSAAVHLLAQCEPFGPEQASMLKVPACRAPQLALFTAAAVW